MAMSVQKLILGNTLAPSQRAQLMVWMRNNTTGYKRIRAGVPIGWVVADKTGSGDYGIANDFSVLVTIRRKGPKAEITIKQVMEKVLLTSGGMTNLLNKLIELNLIKKRKGTQKEDGRSAFVKKYVIENMVVSDDQVAVQTTMHGTHTGDFFGIAPTRKVIQVSQMQIERIANHKIIEHWRVTDEHNLLKQLGQIG